MPVDTSMIDVRSFYERYTTIVGRPSNSRNDGKEYHGPCPWCGGHDRFAFWDSGRYSCSIRSSGCGRHGDPLNFLMEYESLSFFAACERLGVDPGSKYQKPTKRRTSSGDTPPCEQWQERAAALIHMARRVLRSKHGKKALDYLHKRGLTDETICSAELGYIPVSAEGKWYKDTLEQWGLSPEDYKPDVWLYEGILIPWYADGEIWKLNVRRLTGLKENDRKYLEIKGSREGLYNVDTLRMNEPAILCESELDALSAYQECSDMAAAVATGSATRGHRDQWIAGLLLASPVLVAFDDDELKNGKRAGDEGAKYWLDALPHAIHWLPWEHDVNDMLTTGVNLREWLALGISTAALADMPLLEVSPALSTQEPIAPGQAASEFCCSVCSIDLNDIDQDAHIHHETGLAYCSAHWQALQSQPEQASTTTQEQVMSVVNRLATEVLGTDCKVTPLPTGIPRKESLEQHVAKVPRKCTPVALPPLPRKRCPFEIVKVAGRSKDERIKVVPCTGETLENGWCEAHQKAVTLLEIGATLGYPRIDQLGRYVDDYNRQTKYARAIGQGAGSWEGYAQRAPDTWLKNDLPLVKRMVEQQEQQSA